MDWVVDNLIWLIPASGALLVVAKKIVKKTKPTWDDKLVAGIETVLNVVTLGLRKKGK